MNCNIIRSNNKSDNHLPATTNSIKHFPEKNFNRFKFRPSIQNTNLTYKNPRNQLKKSNKRSDEHPLTDNDIANTKHNVNINHEKLETFPFKMLNGDDHSDFSSFNNKNTNFPAEKMFELNKRKFNVSSSYSSKLENYTVELDSDLKSNAAIVERAKIIAKDIMNNSSSIDSKYKKSNQEECAHFMKTEKRKSNYKWINKKHNEMKPAKSSFEKSNSNSANIDKNPTKIKLNFLQESQLTSEQLAADTCKNNNNSKSLPVSVDCVTNMMLQKQINGLNPSALEFTPSVEKKSTEKLDKYSSETIENNLKILNINGDNVVGQQQHQTISNPVVLDDGMINQPFNFSFYDPHYHHHNNNPAGKIPASNDSSLLQNMFLYPPAMPVARPISRINYNQTQTIVPQFQVVPQLIRYNQSQNLPVNYFVYNPVMFNGMYNPILSNRIYPIGTTDIPAAGNLSTQFAHPFNHNSNNSNNNNVISVPNSSQPYFNDSINNNNSNNSPHIR